MNVRGRGKHIVLELGRHSPFTAGGAVLGIAFMLLFRHSDSRVLFSIFHPAHVVLSAMVTASLFKLHRKGTHFLAVLVIGYTGAIGIASLSDCIIPYLGESILGAHIPAHHAHIDRTGDDHDTTAEQVVEPENHDSENTSYGPEIHLGFIEEWYLVNPAALLGVAIGFFLPRTRFPHAGHILISTWASSSHILMNTPGGLTATLAAGMFAVLFIAVWVPCCLSDIIFPLLFIEPDQAELLHHH